MKPTNIVRAAASPSASIKDRSVNIDKVLSGRAPHGFWRDVKNQRAYLEWFGHQRGFKSLDDFYTLTSEQLRTHGNESLLKHYERSLQNALTTIFPEHKWLPWKFHTSRGWWKDPKNQKEFLEWYGPQAGIKTLDDWYSIPMSQLKQVAATLSDTYSGSMVKLMQTVYPEHTWLPWKFVGIGKNLWKSPTTSRLYLERYSLQLGVTKMEDWYLVNYKKIGDVGNTNIMNHFNNSLFKLLQHAYPEYDWKPWKFATTPKSCWGDIETSSQFLSVLAEQLHIETLEDWYRVSLKQLIALKAGGLLRQWGGLYNLLKHQYPHFPWEKSRFNDKGKRSAQRWLKVVLQQAFPKQELLEDHQLQTGPHKTTPISLDVFVPSLSLAFEYQGEQHYHNITFFSPVTQYKARDEAKKTVCSDSGILLVEVPFWWDKTRKGLKDIIYQAIQQNPSVISTESQAAIHSMLQQLETGEDSMFRSSVRGKHRKTVKRSLMLLEDWDTTQDPTNWLLTEKYDGIRAYWDGTYLYTRTGSRVPAPESFTKEWPSMHLDGELWMDYGKMEELLSLSKKQTPETEAWKDVKFMVFDTPENLAPYVQRAPNLKRISQKFPDNLKPVLPVVCEGKDHLGKYLKDIVNKGGEGVVLRDPEAMYTPGRSASCLKLKLFQEGEVRVLRSSQDSILTLLCEQPNGLLCTVRCSGDVAKNPPAAGTVITVQHSGLWDNGRLKHPFFWRVADEKTWEDVVKEAQNSKK